MDLNKNQPWIIGITGASGTIYARRMLQLLLEHAPTLEFEVVVSDSALRVMREEENLSLPAHFSSEQLLGIATPRVRIHNNKNIGANIASGSYRTSGMVIVPCSMATLAAVSHGFGQNLIHRAADVVLKEGRKLILVPRETPLSAIHLENLLRLSKLGAAIVPAMPGFYHQPANIQDLVDMMVMKIVDQMGITLDVAPRWGAKDDERWRTIRSV